MDKIHLLENMFVKVVSFMKFYIDIYIFALLTRIKVQVCTSELYTSYGNKLRQNNVPHDSHILVCLKIIYIVQIL